MKCILFPYKQFCVYINIPGNKVQPQLPLLRLKVTYKSDMHHFNTVRFGQKFMDRVANPVDMVKLKQEKEDTKKNINLLDKEAIDKVIENEVSFIPTKFIVESL